MRNLATPTAVRWLLVAAMTAATVGVAVFGGPAPIHVEPIQLRFVFSSDAESLVEDLDVAAFEARVDSRPVEITTEAAPSGDVQQRVDRYKPSLWMPASSAWVSLLETTRDVDWAPAESPSLVESPQVFVTSGPLAAEILRRHGGADWQLIEELATTDAWRRYAALEGPLDLGHTDPRSSTSGLTAAVSEFELAAGGRDLTVGATRRDPVRHRVNELELRISTYCKIAANLEPELFDVAYMQETSLIELNLERLRHGDPPLVALYPTDRTYVADYPLVVLEGADWMSADEVRAASLFARWLQERTHPGLAASHGYRIPGVEPPFSQQFGPDVTKIGVDPAEPANEATALPSGRVLESVQLAWETVRRRGNVAIVVDESEHARGHLDGVREGIADILAQLEDQDRVGLFTFGGGRAQEVASIRTSDEEQEAKIADAAESLTPSGEAVMWDGLEDAARDLRSLHDLARVDTVVLFGSGIDDGSQDVYGDVYGEFEDAAEEEGNRIRFVFVPIDVDPSSLAELVGRFPGRVARPFEDSRDVYEQIVKEYC